MWIYRKYSESWTAHITKIEILRKMKNSTPSKGRNSNTLCMLWVTTIHGRVMGKTGSGRRIISFENMVWNYLFWAATYSKILIASTKRRRVLILIDGFLTSKDFYVIATRKPYSINLFLKINVKWDGGLSLEV